MSQITRPSRGVVREDDRRRATSCERARAPPLRSRFSLSLTHSLTPPLQQPSLFQVIAEGERGARAQSRASRVDFGRLADRSLCACSFSCVLLLSSPPVFCFVFKPRDTQQSKRSERLQQQQNSRRRSVCKESAGGGINLNATRIRGGIPL